MGVLFSAEDAKVLAKGRRGKTFAFLCENLCVLCSNHSLDYPSTFERGRINGPMNEAWNSTPRIVIDDFDDVGKGDFDDLTIGPLDLDAGRGQGLCILQAAHDAAHAVPVAGHNFDIAFAVERL